MPSSTGRTRAIKLAARDLRKVKKDLKAKPKGRQMQKKNATIVLAQGAVAVPKKNFGTKAFKGNSARAMIKALDARLPRTLGLPRAVGPYTVIRTTRVISSRAKFVHVATFYDSSPPGICMPNCSSRTHGAGDECCVAAVSHGCLCYDKG